MSKYYCGRCGTEREDRADVILTDEGWLCPSCQDADVAEWSDREGEREAWAAAAKE